jgi:hypothetical protein
MSCRPRQILSRFNKSNPTIFRLADAARSAFDPYIVPDWVYLPLEIWTAIAREVGPDQRAVCETATYGTWRHTQGVYQFDRDLAQALDNTPLPAELPSRILLNLPQQAVYVETPEWHFDDNSPIHGFWMHATGSLDGTEPRLMILVDVDPQPEIIVIRLNRASLVDCLEASLGRFEELNGYAPLTLRPLYYRLIGLALYLCSENAEIGNGFRRPARAVPVRGRKGPKFVAPDQATIWHVEAKLGLALRQFETDGGGEWFVDNADPSRPVLRWISLGGTT